MTVLGIDPGKEGGWALVADSNVRPDGSIVRGAYTLLGVGGMDLDTIARIAGSVRPDHVVIERVDHIPGHSRRRNWSFAEHLGELKHVLRHAGYPDPLLLTPNSWRAAVPVVGRAVDIPRHSKSKWVTLAEELFAGDRHERLPVGVRNKRTKDGPAEAALIAVAGLLRYTKEPIRWQ